MVSGLVTWSGGVFTNVYLAESDSNRELYFFLEFLRFYCSSRVLLTSVQTLAIKASCFVDGVNCCLGSKLLILFFFTNDVLSLKRMCTIAQYSDI